MFINSKKAVLLSIFSLFSLIGFFNIFAQSTQDGANNAGVYKKYVHPREYVFDLADAKNKVSLKYEDSTGKAYCSVDFTYLVADDMPRKGDKITFKYEGTASRDVQAITAVIIDFTNGENLGAKVPEIITTAVEKKKTFSKSFSQILNQDPENSIGLRLTASFPESKKKIDKVDLSFKRVTESTNIKKELEAEKKAIAKGLKIVRVKSNYTVIENKVTPTLETAKSEVPEVNEAVKIIDDKKKEPVEQEQALVEEIIEEETVIEETVIEPEQVIVKVQPEKNEIPETPARQEILKQETSTYEPIIVKNKVSQYKKEYLQDYAVADELEILTPDVVEEKKIENPDQKDKNGCTLLMKAAKNGNKDQIKKLIYSDADVNLKDNEGWTALMYAARYQKDLNCLDLLLDAGADVKAVNKYGLTALTFAAGYNTNYQILDRLLKYYSPSDKEVLKSFVLMISENTNSDSIQFEKTKTFVEAQVPVNIFYNGKTPLMYAAQYCRSTKIIRYLLENNAQINVQSTEGKTAFDYAVRNTNLPHDNVYWALNTK